MVEHGRDDAYLLFVSGGEIADILVLIQDFAVHESFESLQPLIYRLLGETVHAAQEVEILFGSEVVDEKTVIDEGTGELFPLFTFLDGDSVYLHISAIGFGKVEDESEKGCLSGTIIAHKTEDLSLTDFIIGNVGCYLFTEILAEIFYFNHDCCISKNVTKGLLVGSCTQTFRLLLSRAAQVLHVGITSFHEAMVHIHEPTGRGDDECKADEQHAEVGNPVVKE